MTRSAKAALLVATALLLASCVVSDKPLLADGEQIAGSHFTARIFRAFNNGKASERRTAMFSWQDGAYAKEPDGQTSVVELVAQKLGGDDYIVQGAYAGKKVFQYWIARRIIDGAYLLFALDETNVPNPVRKKLCAKDRSPDACFVETREQLFVLARATADHAAKDVEIAVVVDDRPSVNPAEPVVR